MTIFSPKGFLCSLLFLLLFPSILTLFKNTSLVAVVSMRSEKWMTSQQNNIAYCTETNIMSLNFNALKFKDLMFSVKCWRTTEEAVLAIIHNGGFENEVQ